VQGNEGSPLPYHAQELTVDELEQLLDVERSRLVAVLRDLDDAGWNAPSLCAGWRVRDVVVHLTMPYRLSVPGFLAQLARSGFRFDAMADRWARASADSHAEVLQSLRDTADARFRVPGAPPEAPLSHLVAHAEDVYLPLGVDHRIDPRAATIVLDQLTSPRGRRSLGPDVLHGLAATATDSGWTYGAGPEVIGSSAALISAVAGRRAAADELTGSGAALVRRRLARSLA
jgi:uncharacterized protein (TIGR03083 family)